MVEDNLDSFQEEFGVVVVGGIVGIEEECFGRDWHEEVEDILIGDLGDLGIEQEVDKGS